MKILLTILIVSSTVFGAGYKEFAKKMQYETNYEIALKKAKKDKKDIMFFMIANFCPWCVKFEKKVLEKKDINKLIHKKYIPLIINKEEKNFPKQFKTPIVPTVYFVDFKTQKIKTKVVGYNSRTLFINEIRK